MPLSDFEKPVELVCSPWQLGVVAKVVLTHQVESADNEPGHVRDLTRMSIGHSTNVGNCADWTFSNAALIAQKK